MTNVTYHNAYMIFPSQLNRVITCDSCRLSGGRSGTVGEKSPRCFFWVLPKRSIPKPDQHS